MRQNTTCEAPAVLHAGMGRMAAQQGQAEVMQCVKVGKLNLVDLAGSERVHITGATGAPQHFVVLSRTHMPSSQQS
jgi:hypothetical protein